VAILNRPLRVMHIISGDLWAGAEVQAYTLLKHLVQDVDIFVILMNQGELSEKLRQQGIKVQIIDEKRHSSPYIVFSILRLIRQFKPDVIHTHRQKENILGSIANLLAMPFRGKLTPSIRTAHGAPEFRPKGKQKIQVWLDRWVGRWLQKKVIAVSNDLAEKLLSIFPANHIVVIPNGVDQESLRQQASLIADFRQISPDKTHIGIIGRLEPVKRIDIFLEMAALLLKEGKKDWQFHVIGDGKLRPELETMANQLNISAQVCFHGHRTDIPSCIASLDAIIMCSDHEGTPMTALEAMALGTPLIAHDVGGLREILSEHNELLVGSHTSEDYRSCLSRIMVSPISHLQLKEKYQAKNNAESTEELYAALR
jgi:L-malate glycosyltransferase